jgi:hypothetical protein
MAEERLSGFFYSSLSAGRNDGRAPAHGLSRKISSILTGLAGKILTSKHKIHKR